jgi:hypothetical protein
MSCGIRKRLIFCVWTAVPIMAEAQFVAAIMAGESAYQRLQTRCLRATLEALSAAYDAAGHDETRTKLRDKIKFISDMTSSTYVNDYARDICPGPFPRAYPFNSPMTDVWGAHLTAHTFQAMLDWAVRSLRWDAIQQLLCSRNSEQRFYHIYTGHFMLSGDDFQCLLDIMWIADRSWPITPDISVACPSDTIIPLTHLWALWPLCAMRILRPFAAKHGITNDRTIHHNVGRVHVERLAALIACVSDGYLRDPKSTRFWHIVQRLPCDLQEVLANRCYDCVRDIVVMKRGIYWALKLGDCHKYTTEEDAVSL